MIGVKMINFHIKQYFVVFFGYSVKMWGWEGQDCGWLRFGTPRQLKYYDSDGLESKPVRKMSDYFTENNQFLCFGAKNHISCHIPEYLTSKLIEDNNQVESVLKKKPTLLSLFIYILYIQENFKIFYRFID